MSLVLLHGLTFDKRHWDPLRRVLPAGRPVLAPDLPGHGDAPRRDTYRMAEVAGIIHDQVTAAGLTEPVLIGHSIGGIIATKYAALYPARAVINLDQPLLPGPFGATVRQAEPLLRGPDWRQFWDRMLAGMAIGTLPPEARKIVENDTDPRPDLLLGYWDELLHHTDEAIRAERQTDLAALREREVGYRWVTAGEPPLPYLGWLTAALPSVAVTVMPGSHFPHLADPAAIAALIPGQ
ncbi:alpha/beta fold hydrolase [Actinoplanes sp. NPDC048796]|uniref:alpha/beta fold hydrolase n=1 Tax=Actinoplanes sp. NPDC048796 TaxID=3155640 RepID=UPI0033CEC6CE